MHVANAFLVKTRHLNRSELVFLRTKVSSMHNQILKKIANLHYKIGLEGSHFTPLTDSDVWSEVVAFDTHVRFFRSDMSAMTYDNAIRQQCLIITFELERSHLTPLSDSDVGIGVVISGTYG